MVMKNALKLTHNENNTIITL